MVKLRLRRMGRHKRPLYAVVAADARSPRDGKYIEDLGRYEPLHEPALLKLKRDRILYWLEEGAQPTDTVRSLFSREGIMLALHMRRKGAEPEAVEAAVEAHCAAVEEKRGAGKKTAKDRKREMLAAEGKVAATQDAELAKQRAEAEAKARVEAEAAQKVAAEERARAAEEAKKAQADANEEAKKAQVEANAETTEADATPKAKAAPDADAAAKAEAAPKEKAAPKADKAKA